MGDLVLRGAKGFDVTSGLISVNQVSVLVLAILQHSHQPTRWSPKRKGARLISPDFSTLAPGTVGVANSGFTTLHPAMSGTFGRLMIVRPLTRPRFALRVA